MHSSVCIRRPAPACSTSSSARICARPVTGARRRLRASASPTAEQAKDMVKFQHLLLTIMDANQFLSEGSKQAVATAALLAQSNAGRVTVLVIDEPGTTPESPEKQMENITWHLRDKGVDKFEVLQRATTEPASVLIGDVADEVEADMVLVSSMAVHAKHVDANQLCEFVACPLLVLP